MCNDFYHWEYDSDTGFRKLVLDYTHTNIRENLKMRHWTGETRVCSKCKVELPENTYFFMSGGGAFHRYCKVCEGSPKYGWGRKYNKELNNSGLHYCSKCDRILPLNNLYFVKTKGKNNKTGFSSNCKECANYENGYGIDKINNCSDIYRQNDYKICSYCFIEYPDNPDYFFNRLDRKNGSTTCKKCYGYKIGIQRLNKVLKGFVPEGFKYCNQCKRLLAVSEITGNGMCRECAKPRRQEYNKRPEVKERHRLARQKRRSLEKEVHSNLTVEDIEYIFKYFNYECAYCGMEQEDHLRKYNENLHCDHIHPLSKGGQFIYGNVIPSCRSCNTSKHTKDIFAFYDYSETFTYGKLKIILNYISLFLNN